MNLVCDYLFEYDFPEAYLFEPKLEEIVNNFFETVNTSQGYNACYNNTELLNIVDAKFQEIVHSEFEVSEQLNQTQLWTYCQNNRLASNVSHHHANSTTINAVFYINPPNQGGGLEYILEDGKHVLQPNPGKIYLFPYWLIHKPLPQREPEWRISVNLEYLCAMRPLHYRTGIKW